MSDWENADAEVDIEGRSPVRGTMAVEYGRVPDEQFWAEYARRKRDEGTERDPLVQARRAAERLRRIRI